jgi:hypothetical protein
VVPIFNYFQVALVMFEDGRLAAPQVTRVAVEMVDRFGYTLDALRNSLSDLLRRSRLRVETARTLGAHLGGGSDGQALVGALPESRELLAQLGTRLEQLDDVPAVMPAPPSDLRIDFLAALEVDLPRRRKSR